MIPIVPSAIPARRFVLEKRELDLTRVEHAGLTLSRYLRAHKPVDQEERAKLKQTYEEELLESVSNAKAGEPYVHAFRRWSNWLEVRGYQSLYAELTSSLAIGLGNESPLEVGLTVHHTYGMPVIPGSAIKGMCRRGASKLVAERKVTLEQFSALFGDTGSASCLVFYDGWYDPESVDGKPFHRDVITVHHPDYYKKKGDVCPTDFDDPTPVPFLVVRRHAKFLFVIGAPSKEWGKFATELLRWCLENLGVGAKTNAGYGYFKPDAVAMDADSPPNKRQIANATSPDAPPASAAV